MQFKKIFVFIASKQLIAFCLREKEKNVAVYSFIVKNKIFQPIPVCKPLMVLNLWSTIIIMLYPMSQTTCICIHTFRYM